ncbi:alpha/beta hydrolase [Sphingobium sp. Sx8-8]|uniref:alpha/beta fold hydrolase n=1 Tax=Sphingobium sp. Sx8-8 TaxID=2933617 RepID=UPI001F5A3CFF|nr:alpha/beta hydrolase [Sphingobium sp. Sx8-8]
MTEPTPPTAAAPLSQWLASAWAVEAETHRVEVEGAGVNYRRWRPASHAPRPGLVFVHGFMAHSHWWDHIAPHFLQGHDIIAPDFTGMGDSDRRTAYSRRQYARETIAAIRHAGLRDVTIVAHSFGSVSSLHAALQAPDLIRRVIVIDAFVFRPDRQDFDGSVPTERRYPTQEAALARYRLTPPGLWPVPEIIDYLSRHSLRQDGEAWTWKFDPLIHAGVDETGVRAELRGFSCPTDFIYGENSEIAGAEEAASFRANLPGSGVPVVVPLSHHHVMIEQPAALVAALQGLLSRP